MRCLKDDPRFGFPTKPGILSAPKDAFGVVVPERLARVFQARKLMWKWAGRINYLAYEIEKLGCLPGAQKLDAEKARRLLEEVRDLIYTACPHKECDCNPADVWCPDCENARWLSDGQYRAACDRKRESRLQARLAKRHSSPSMFSASARSATPASK